MAHMAFSPALYESLRQKSMKTILLVRDPRDVVVSLVRFMCRNPHLEGHEFYMNLPDDETRFRTAFYGKNRKNGPRLKSVYKKYLMWHQHGSLLLRFEDLRGHMETRRCICSSILEHLELDETEMTLEQMLKSLESRKSRTFRKGGSGEYLKVLKPELIEQINESMGDILEELGYSN